MQGEEIKKLALLEIEAAKKYSEEDLAPDRERALRYYNGEPDDLNVADHKSKVLTRYTADTVNYMMPQIMRVFMSSDKVCEVRAEGVLQAMPKPEDFDGVEEVNEEEIKNAALKREQKEAKEATLLVNHIFLKNNNGYQIIWDATLDALLGGNGIVKYWYDDTKECEHEELTDISDDQYFELMGSDDIEITTHSEKDGLHDVKCQTVKSNGRIKITAIKPENFLIDSAATSIETARFVAHREEITRSDLVAMGYSKAKVYDLPIAGSTQDEINDARGSSDVDDTANKAMEVVEYHECFMQVDVDDDGEAETVRVCIGGKALLHWETLEEDDFPFADFVPERVAHRWRGASVAEKTIPLERLGSTLLREVMDNLYLTNAPQREVDLGSVENPDVLVSGELGGIIWKKAGSSPIQSQVVPFTAGQSFPIIQYVDDLVIRATGVDRNSSATNPDTLQNQTATAVNASQSMAYSRIELVCRNFAKTGFERLFTGILKLLKSKQKEGIAVRASGQSLTVNPSEWQTDMGVSVNVGLGSGTREKDALALNNIMQHQVMLADKFEQTGMAEQALDMLPKVIDVMKKTAEVTGVSIPEQYYPDIDEDNIKEMKAKLAEKASQPPQEDPEITLKREKMMADIVLEKEKMQADFALKQQEMQLEAELAQQKLIMTGQMTGSDMNIRGT